MWIGIKFGKRTKIIELEKTAFDFIKQRLFLEVYLLNISLSAFAGKNLTF